MSRSTRTLLLGAAALLGVALVLALTGGDDSSPETATRSTTAATDPPTTTTAAAPTTSTTATAPTTTLDSRFVELVEQTSDLIERSTPEELAYRLVVTGLTGTDLTGRLIDTVGSRCVGGLFLTESNNNWTALDDAEAFRSAVDYLDNNTWLDSGCDFRPLITTDAELGSVVRVPIASPAAAPDWTERYVTGEPYNVLLDLQDQASTYAAGLRSLGVDVNFGAVADVATAPDHFMARQGRTFGDDPGIVAALANAVVQGHCVSGVAPTLKHFPNQGATLEDPHRERSTAIGGIDLWETTGRLPYIGTEAPVVMTGHIFMDIDPDLPASMSPTITTDLLRGNLGYDGVVITDDLSTMRGAIDVIPDAGDRAVAAIRAGADLVLFVDDRDIPRVVEALVAEMEADPDVFIPRAQSAFRRVLRLQLGLRDPELFPLCRPQG